MQFSVLPYALQTQPFHDLVILIISDEVYKTKLGVRTFHLPRSHTEHDTLDEGKIRDKFVFWNSEETVSVNSRGEEAGRLGGSSGGH